VETSAVAVQSYFRGLLIDARYVDRRRRCYRIGSSRRVQAPAAESLIGGAEHALVTVDERGAAALHLTPAMIGPARLPAHGDAEIRCGSMTFRIAHAPPPPTLPAPAARWRGSEARASAGVGLATIVALGVLALVPPDRKALSLDVDQTFHRRAAVRIVPPVLATAATTADQPAGEGAASDPRTTGRPGMARAAKATKLTVRGISQRRQPAVSPEPLTMLSLIARARSASVRATFARGQALGPDAETVLGSLNGDGVAAAWDRGGFGVVGTGAYDAGAGDQLIREGDPLETIGGRNPFLGRAHGPPVAALTPRPRIVPIIDVVRERLTSKGSLDKEIVRRIIRAHLNEIRYCYETELARRPTLAGRVVLQFAIAPSGQVLSSVVQDSTLHLVPLESCMTQSVRRWIFPQPAGGGLTVVSYPFVLAPAGN